METNPVAISALPVRLEAMQWNGENEESVRKFIQPETSMKVKDGGLILVWNDDSEEWQNAPISYYIIKEVNGNYFTCSPEAFARNYEAVK